MKKIYCKNCHELKKSVTAIKATFTLSSGATAQVGTTAQVSGVTDNDFTNTVHYIITADNGTTTQNWAETITGSTGLTDMLADAGAVVYPNPSSGLFRIKLNVSDRVQLEVYNLEGSKIIEQFVEANSEGLIPVDLTGNPAGIYLLRFLLKIKLHKLN